MIDIKEVLLQWFIKIYISNKSASGSGIKMKICKTKSELKNYTNQLLESLFKIRKVYSSVTDNI